MTDVQETVVKNGVKRPVEGADKVLFDLFDAVSAAQNSATTLDNALASEIAADIELHLPEGVANPTKYIRNVYFKWVQFHGVYDLIPFDAQASKTKAEADLAAAEQASLDAKAALSAAKSALKAAEKYVGAADGIAERLKTNAEGRAAKSQERAVETAKRKMASLADKLRAAGIDPLTVMQAGATE